MTKCVYCKEDSTLTREHLIPDWYSKNIEPRYREFFLERAKQRFIKSDVVIKDVCAVCNNKRLGRLDDYAKQVYASTLCKPVYKQETICLTVDYQIFVKWLLKVAYNSARINDADLEILDDYSNMIIGDFPLPENLHIYVDAITPSIVDADGKPRMAYRHEACDASNPNGFRVGCFRVPEVDTCNWVLRHVGVDSFWFTLFIPKMTGDGAKNDELALLKAIKSGDRFGVELCRSGTTTLVKPYRDTFTSQLSHINNFPFSYNLVDEEDLELKKVIEDEKVVCFWKVERKEIESQDTRNVFLFLSGITSSREIALGFAGKVEIIIDGYEDDPRELWEIREVREFFNTVDKEYPYWMFFQCEEGLWLQVLFLCLCEFGRKNHGKNVVEIEEEVVALVQHWFDGLNKLCHAYGISETINKRLGEVAVKEISKILNESGNGKDTKV